MCAYKEHRLLKELVELLRSDKVQVGERLSSERELSKVFNASRNTLRNAIKTVVASGAIEVKPGSGYFLVSKTALDDIQLESRGHEDKSRISEQLEAFFLFEPTAVVLATERMTKDEKKQLEDCVVNMSHAVLGNDINKIVNSHRSFHQIIATGTGNRSIRQMLERLEITYVLVANVIHQISPEERNKIFARHVNLYKAISSGDTEAARKMSLQMILSTSLMLNRFEGIKLPETVSSEIDNQIIDMKKRLSETGDEQ